jgi:hypothetical protein
MMDLLFEIENNNIHNFSQIELAIEFFFLHKNNAAQSLVESLAASEIPHSVLGGK